MYDPQEETLSVLLIDDHKLVSEAVARFLSNEGGLSVSVANDISEAERCIRNKGPLDVILLDLVMPDMQGTQSIEKIVKLNQGGAVVLFSGSAGHHDLHSALDVGCKGLIPKNLPLRALESAIRLVASGEFFLRASRDEGPSATISLNERELFILSQIADGKKNKEIAWSLKVSEVTVKSYVRKICITLGANNRASAAVKAKQLALI